ncbi:ubiquinone/menaquinone biosynthesis methyltransferase [Thermincola ferriacetica]|uniref:Demethylmenaquinone methyltransferase n=1 Tax=Thermincola ferriacetica TaxID=281456 RepID=A0A0L6W2K0_9FIRM|nr:demethylmenaquinone methyltransferase [Thermincola ferriacetica]KNZ69608.1 ubiquinone/menaquinone biosynthesis methyltransferase [Thermincola ferriacetica]
MTKLPSKENKEKFVRDMFNSIARRYDLMNTLMTGGLDKKWRKFAVKRAELQPGGYGLDVCCGTGMLTMELARAAGLDGRVTGLDFSEKMLAVAKENLKNFDLKDNISLIQGNAMALPFAENTFDCATVGWGLRNVPDIMTALREMVRVVKPGAKVVSLDMAQPTAPVFKQLYWFCFEKVIPAMGKLWAGNKGAYSYLHASAKVFPNQKVLVQMFREAGLVETKYHNFCGGVVAVVEGRKP